MRRTTMLVFARSIERELAHGQINAILLFLVVSAFSLLGSRPVSAGLLLALAALLKPHWLILLPYLLLTRRVRASVAFAIGFIVGVVLPAFRYGLSTIDLHTAMQMRLAESTARLLTHPTNVSLIGAIAKATRADAGLAIGVGVLAVPVALFAHRLTRRPRGDRASLVDDLAVLSPLVVLVSPQAWDYTVLTTLPA